MKNIGKKIAVATLVPLVGGVGWLAAATHLDARPHDREHDVVRQAVLKRELLPLPRILALASRYESGTIIEIELEAERGTIVYDVHVLRGDGAVRELLIDARTGKLIASQPKDD